MPWSANKENKPKKKSTPENHTQAPAMLWSTRVHTPPSNTTRSSPPFQSNNLCYRLRCREMGDAKGVDCVRAAPPTIWGTTGFSEVPYYVPSHSTTSTRARNPNVLCTRRHFGAWLWVLCPCTCDLFAAASPRSNVNVNSTGLGVDLNCQSGPIGLPYRIMLHPATYQPLP